MDDLISKLSEIRSDYNCFDEDGEPYYRALSEAIKILSQLADGDTISRQAAIDALDCINGAEEVLRALPSVQPEILACGEGELNVPDTNVEDMISRQAAIDAIMGQPPEPHYPSWYAAQVEKLPAVQPERDIPIKPYETTDTAWGIQKKQAVCPKCDYYLGHVAFLGDYKGKKVTYCETCGQAIDWEGWDFDEWGGEEE